MQPQERVIFDEALCSILAGLALLRLEKIPADLSNLRARYAIRILGGMITIIAVLNLVEQVFGLRGVSWFSALAMSGTSGPGPMALLGALSFRMIGVSLLLVDRHDSVRAVEALTLISAAFCST